MNSKFFKWGPSCCFITQLILFYFVNALPLLNLISELVHSGRSACLSFDHPSCNPTFQHFIAKCWRLSVCQRELSSFLITRGCSNSIEETQISFFLSFWLNFDGPLCLPTEQKSWCCKERSSPPLSSQPFASRCSAFSSLFSCMMTDNISCMVLFSPRSSSVVFPARSLSSILTIFLQTLFF